MRGGGPQVAACRHVGGAAGLHGDPVAALPHEGRMAIDGEAAVAGATLDDRRAVDDDVIVAGRLGDGVGAPTVERAVGEGDRVGAPGLRGDAVAARRLLGHGDAAVSANDGLVVARLDRHPPVAAQQGYAGEVGLDGAVPGAAVVGDAAAVAADDIGTPSTPQAGAGVAVAVQGQRAGAGMDFGGSGRLDGSGARSRPDHVVPAADDLNFTHAQARQHAVVPAGGADACAAFTAVQDEAAAAQAGLDRRAAKVDVVVCRAAVALDGEEVERAIQGNAGSLAQGEARGAAMAGYAGAAQHIPLVVAYAFLDGCASTDLGRHVAGACCNGIHALAVQAILAGQDDAVGHAGCCRNLISATAQDFGVVQAAGAALDDDVACRRGHPQAPCPALDGAVAAGQRDGVVQCVGEDLGPAGQDAGQDEVCHHGAGAVCAGAVEVGGDACGSGNHAGRVQPGQAVAGDGHRDGGLVQHGNGIWAAVVRHLVAGDEQGRPGVRKAFATEVDDGLVLGLRAFVDQVVADKALAAIGQVYAVAGSAVEAV